MTQEKLTEEQISAILQAALDSVQASNVIAQPNGNSGSTSPAHSAAVVEEKKFANPQQQDIDDLQTLVIKALNEKIKEGELKLKKLAAEVDGLSASNGHRRAVSRGVKIDNRLRLQMAAATFQFMQYWCAFVALMFFIYMAKKDGAPPPEVIIALLGTTTISIVGLVGFVVSGLFKSPKDSSEDKEKK